MPLENIFDNLIEYHSFRLVDEHGRAFPRKSSHVACYDPWLCSGQCTTLGNHPSAITPDFNGTSRCSETSTSLDTMLCNLAIGIAAAATEQEAAMENCASGYHTRAPATARCLDKPSAHWRGFFPSISSPHTKIERNRPPCRRRRPGHPKSDHAT